MKRFLLLLIALLSCAIYAQHPADDIENEWGFINTIPDYGAGSHWGAIYALSPNIVVLSAKKGMMYRTLDGGENWTSYLTYTEEDYLDMKFADMLTGYAVGTNGVILKTDDMGATWSSLYSGTTHSLWSIYINNDHDIWVVGDDGVILHSTDAGNSWVLDDLTTNESLYSIAFQDDSVGYIAGKNGTLLKTINGGQAWNQVSLDSNDDLFSISITEATIYIAQGMASDYNADYYAEKFLKSTDGNNWTTYGLPYESPISKIVFTTDSTGYAIGSGAYLCDCCDASIFKTADGGENWEYSFFMETGSNPCIANEGFSSISLVDTTGYVFQGNHILKLHGGDEHSDYLDVEEFNEKQLKIYPNPSHNFVTVDWDKEISGSLNLSIYDIQGKLIYTLPDLPRKKEIDLTHFSAGIYFIQLETNHKLIKTTKLVKHQ